MEGKLNYVPNMLSCNPTFQPTSRKLDDLKIKTILPASFFALIQLLVKDSPLFYDILKAQTENRDQVTVGNTSPYRILNNVILYHGAVWVPTNNLRL